VIRAVREFVELAGRLPAFEEVWRGQPLGAWCCKQIDAYVSKKLGGGLAQQWMDIPGWDWDGIGLGRLLSTCNCEECRRVTPSDWEPMRLLLRQFVEEHSRLPHEREEWRGKPLGAWCSKRKAECRSGTLRALARQLEQIPGWHVPVRT
jgi:hypothetical protein